MTPCAFAILFRLSLALLAGMTQDKVLAHLVRQPEGASFSNSEWNLA